MNKNPKYDNDFVTLKDLKNYLSEDGEGTDSLIKIIPKSYAAPPRPPYYVGTILYYQHSIYRCKTERTIGFFIWDDWELVGTDDNGLINWIDSEYTVDIAAIQEQIDKKIETYYQATDPNTWTTDIEKARHVGDFWYNTTNNTEWRWSQYDTNPITYGWRHVNVPDSVFDLIDTKKSIYVTKPTSYNENDMWIIEDDLPDADLPIGTVENPIVRGDWVFATQNSTSYNKAHWVKLDEDVSIEYLEEYYYTTAEVEQRITETKSQTITEVSALIDYEHGLIENVVREVTETSNPNSLINRVGDLEGAISDIADITTSGETTEATLDLTDIIASEPVILNIKPIGQNISYLYPRDNLYPSDTLYMSDRKIRFINKSEYEATTDTIYTSYKNYYTKSGNIYTLLVAGTDYTIGDTISGTKYQNKYYDYTLPGDLLYYDSNNYDEFMLDYNSTACYIKKKCKYNADGTVGLLDSPRTDDYSANYPQIDLTAGDYTITILNQSTGYIFIRLMCNNLYAGQYYTKSETLSKISQKANEITTGVNQTLTGYSTTTQMSTAINQAIENNNSAYVAVEVAKKVNNTDYTRASIVAKINDNTSQALIQADKINLSGYLTISSASNTYETRTNASSTYASKASLAAGTTTIDGDCIETGTLTANKIASNAITSDKIAANAITSSKIASNAITSDKIAAGSVDASKVTSNIITTNNFSSQTIDAGQITTGTLNADVISSNSITADKIANATITGAKIVDSSISGAKIDYIWGEKIVGGTIDASVVSVKNLDASKITSGTISTSRLSSNVITTSNFSSQNINASNIRSGTLTSTNVRIGSWSLNGSGIHSSNVRLYPDYFITSLDGVQGHWSNVPWSAIGRAGAAYSDKKLKKNIKSLDDKFNDFFDELKPVSFKWKNTKIKQDEKTHIGFIAQDIQEAGKNNDLEFGMVYEIDGKLFLDKKELIALNTWQIQKLKQENIELKNAINELKKEIQEIKEKK